MNKLYIDFDNTIVDTTAAICSLYNQDFCKYNGFRIVHPEEIQSYEFCECYCAYPGYINHLFNTPRFFRELRFMPGAYTALKELSKDFDISVISAGYSPNLLNKNEWIKEYLPFVKHFIPVNLKEHKDKSNFNLSDGIFIDDEVKNLVTSDAPYKILFGQSQTWNGCWEGLKSNNWSDLKPMIYALALADNMEAKNESN